MTNQRAPALPTDHTLHSPTRVARETATWIEHVKNARTFTFGVAEVDKMLLPLYPGRLLTVLSRPGHGKTSMLAYWARNMAEKVLPDSGAIIYVSLEQYVEEIATMLASHVGVHLDDVYRQNTQEDKVLRTILYLTRSPLWIIGYSIQEHGRAVLHSPEGSNFVLPRLTKDVILNCVLNMEKQYKIKPLVLLLDYLQMLPVEGPGRPFEKIQQIPPQLKQLSMRLKIPVIAAVQAGRDVDKRGHKLPQMHDAQWASTIEQASDVVLSLWRLSLTEKIGDIVKLNGQEIAVTEDMLLLGLVKQRGGPAPGKWLLKFDPATLKYTPYIIQKTPF